jgi:hypothetical protein
VLEPYGDDSRAHERNGNPQRLSHYAETAENPNRVWTLSRFNRRRHFLPFRAIFRR